MHFIDKEKKIYEMSKDNVPNLTVNDGDTVVMETYDCYTGQMKNENSSAGGSGWDGINPATGPVYVEGLKPNDVLKADIQTITLSDRGVMVNGPGAGVMGSILTERHVKFIDIDSEKELLNFNGIDIPLNPMIGVIGVAPLNTPVNNGTPDNHGGNMDSVKVTEGASLYLPVYHDGALFALGDVHAAMGDGEVSISGVEISAEVTVRLQKADNMKISHPLLSDDDGVYMMVSDESLDTAVDLSVKEMIRFLHPYTDLSLNEITMLMSIVGQTQINQVVDPKKTARFFVPRYVLNHYNIPI
ncbi:acetamidase/formamidase family protein [Corticicoccus populi]|uniref:Acetamidase/formamidase family protein n=1 Tax=Corticicoccus populi TaxID=1812821 RepID=A0ABW5WZA8_9STAP